MGGNLGGGSIEGGGRGTHDTGGPKVHINVSCVIQA